MVFQRRQVVFPQLARAGVALVVLVRELEVQARDGGGEEGGAGAVADGGELGVVSFLGWARGVRCGSVELTCCERLAECSTTGKGITGQRSRWMDGGLTDLRWFIRRPIADMVGGVWVSARLN